VKIRDYLILFAAFMSFLLSLSLVLRAKKQGLFGRYLGAFDPGLWCLSSSGLEVVEHVRIGDFLCRNRGLNTLTDILRGYCR